MAHPQIAIFARLAKEGDEPLRKIFGQATKLSRTMHDIRYDEVHDEIFVTNPFAQAILAFRGDADGNADPIRVIQGPKTGLGGADTLGLDSVNEELVLPEREGDGFLVFSSQADGDVAPLRHFYPGPDSKTKWVGSRGIGIDPIHNVIVTDGTLEDGSPGGDYDGGRDSILIFDRLANGAVEPLRVIRGPKTGIHGIRQLQVYPGKGWIIVAQITDGGIPIPEGTFVGVWSINDSGNVPPRWKIPGHGYPDNIMQKPRGVVLNPKHKELIVSDMRLNAVLTFYFPEIF